MGLNPPLAYLLTVSSLMLLSANMYIIKVENTGLQKRRQNGKDRLRRRLVRGKEKRHWRRQVRQNKLDSF